MEKQQQENLKVKSGPFPLVAENPMQVAGVSGGSSEACLGFLPILEDWREKIRRARSGLIHTRVVPAHSGSSAAGVCPWFHSGLVPERSGQVIY